MSVKQKLTNEQLSSVGIKRTDNGKNMHVDDANTKNSKNTSKKNNEM